MAGYGLLPSLHSGVSFLLSIELRRAQMPSRSSGGGGGSSSSSSSSSSSGSSSSSSSSRSRSRSRTRGGFNSHRVAEITSFGVHLAVKHFGPRPGIHPNINGFRVTLRLSISDPGLAYIQTSMVSASPCG